MEQNKISRRNFMRVAGASATAAAKSGLVPAASHSALAEAAAPVRPGLSRSYPNRKKAASSGETS